jgi:hypothetical protein
LTLSTIAQYDRAIEILRPTRVLLCASVVALILAPAAHARASSTRTLTIRAPVPAAGDMSVVAFEMSIGGEGKHHHRQAVSLLLRNHRETGVFALARLRPEPHHAGRFLGVLEVFHRASTGKVARAAGDRRARASGGFTGDEFLVRARNEHIVKQVIKSNIIGLAELHHLGPDDFCDPLTERSYLLGNAIIGAAYVLAGPLSGLPAGTSPGALADDAVHELCDEVEDYGEEDYETDDEEEFPGIASLLGYLGHVSMTRPPSGYRVGFSGQWAFVDPTEVRLLATFSGAYIAGGARVADSTNPISAIKVVLPPAGTTPRAVTNYICPTQLPTAAITTTRNANDTLMCSGGSLPINQQFSLNVQSSPPPSSGMGGQLIAQQDGTYLTPFSFGGP